jgi:hypothetical protein
MVEKDTLTARDIIGRISDMTGNNFVDVMWSEREDAQDIRQSIRFADWWAEYKKRIGVKK